MAPSDSGVSVGPMLGTAVSPGMHTPSDWHCLVPIRSTQHAQDPVQSSEVLQACVPQRSSTSVLSSVGANDGSEEGDVDGFEEGE